MPSYTLKILPPNSDTITSEQIERITKVLNGQIICDPPLIFDQNSSHPTSGFEVDTVKITDYGFAVKFAFEEELNIPTVDGQKTIFKKTSVDGKFIKKEGILLIGSANDKVVEQISKKWMEAMFPDRIVSCVNLDMTKEQLHKLGKEHAKTVIEVSHIKCKGLDKIRMRAYDLPNKEWYKDEDFESAPVFQITFIPKLTGLLANRTSICRIYKSGKIVIYHNSQFTEAEFEQIELQLVDILGKVLGAPLCKRGSKVSQGRL